MNIRRVNFGKKSVTRARRATSIQQQVVEIDKAIKTLARFFGLVKLLRIIIVK